MKAVEIVELGALCPTTAAARQMSELYGKGYRLTSTVARGDSVLFTLVHASQRPSRRLPRPLGPASPKPSEVDNTALLRALGG